LDKIKLQKILDIDAREGVIVLGRVNIKRVIEETKYL
jgi:hypothetical protein